MGKKIVHSCASITAPPENDLFDQGLLARDEVCSFNDDDMQYLKTNGTFPSDTILRSFDLSVQPDFVSPSWVCFPKYPFSLGLKYPFSGIIFDFFQATKLSYCFGKK